MGVTHRPTSCDPEKSRSWAPTMTAAPSNPWTGKRADLCTVSRAVERGQGRVSLDLEARADLFHGARAPLEVAPRAKRTPDLQHFLLGLLRLGGRRLVEPDG